MPKDLYDHVQANMTWRDDIWVFVVFAPLFALALLTIAVLCVLSAPREWWRRRHGFHGCAL